MSCAHSLPRMLAGVCLYMQRLSSFEFVVVVVVVFSTHFNQFASDAWIFLSLSLPRSVVVYELITCHVPMVIIMMIANASKQEQLSYGWQIAQQYRRGAVDVDMLRYCMFKMHCLWLSACASLQLCHCSIHFGRIPLFLFLIFLNAHGCAIAILFCYCKLIFFCLFPSYFSALALNDCLLNARHFRGLLLSLTFC